MKDARIKREGGVSKKKEKSIEPDGSAGWIRTWPSVSFHGIRIRFFMVLGIQHLIV